MQVSPHLQQLRAYSFQKVRLYKGISPRWLEDTRCNPWSMGGFDPVPEKFTFKVKKYYDYPDGTTPSKTTIKRL